MSIEVLLKTLDDRLVELNKIFSVKAGEPMISDEDVQSIVEGTRASPKPENTPLIDPEVLNRILGRIEGQLNLAGPERHA